VQLEKPKHWKLERSQANTKTENGIQLKTLEKTLTPLAKPPQVDPNNKQLRRNTTTSDTSTT